MDWKSVEKIEDGVFRIPDRWLRIHYYEALNLLFRVENALRILVYVILKAEYSEKWTNLTMESEGADTTIGAKARQREKQASNFGYLGFPVTSPLMYLTTGELIRIILSDSYWKYFKAEFPAGKHVVETKFAEINSVRNALAHFRPLNPDDVETVKQASKHVLTSVERTLDDLLACPDSVPTNSSEEWYSILRALRNDQCRLAFAQSPDKRWCRVDVRVRLSILSKRTAGRGYFSFTVANIDSPAILREFSDLTDRATYLIESPEISLLSAEGKASFEKTLSFGFARSVLSTGAGEIGDGMAGLLSLLSEETELIEQDNLARGRLMKTASLGSTVPEGRDHGYISPDPLYSGYSEGDPAEWWGNIDLFERDFISATHTYPWMPVDVAAYQFPF